MFICDKSILPIVFSFHLHLLSYKPNIIVCNTIFVTDLQIL